MSNQILKDQVAQIDRERLNYLNVSKALAKNPDAADASLLLDFTTQGYATGVQGIDTPVNLLDLATFTRATNETAFNQRKSLVTFGSGVPAVPAYNPATGEPLGLQVFEQRTNRWLYSTNLLNVYWAGTRIVNSETSTPSVIDGVTWKRATATETNANGFFFRSPITALDGITTISSQYIVKKGNKDWCLINAIGSGGGACRQWFNLSTGEKGAQVNAGTVGDVTFVGSTIEGLGGNAYKITMTVTFNTSVNNYFNMYPAANADSSLAVELNDYADFCYQGAEAGAFATPPIFTEATTATRNASVAVINNINTMPFWNASEGELRIKAGKINNPNGSLFSLSDGTASNRMYLRRSSSAFQVIAFVGGVAQSATLGSYIDGENEVIFRYGGGLPIRASVNGSAFVSLASYQNVPSVTRLNIGDVVGGIGNTLGGHIAQIAYYPSAGV